MSTQMEFRKTQLAIALAAAFSAGATVAADFGADVTDPGGWSSIQLTDFVAISSTKTDVQNIPGTGNGSIPIWAESTPLNPPLGLTTTAITDLNVTDVTKTTDSGSVYADASGNVTLTGGNVTTQQWQYDLATIRVLDSANNELNVSYNVQGTYTNPEQFDIGDIRYTETAEFLGGGNLTMDGLATVKNGIDVTTRETATADAGTGAGLLKVDATSAQLGVKNAGGGVNGFSANATSATMTGGTGTSTWVVDDNGARLNTDGTETFSVDADGNATVAGTLTVNGTGPTTFKGDVTVEGATTTNGITNTGDLLSQSNDGTAGLEVINGSARMGVKNADGVYNGIAINSGSAAVGAANANGDYNGLLVTGSSAVLAVASDDGSYHNYVMLEDNGVTINGGSGTTSVTVNSSGLAVSDSVNGQTFAVNSAGDATVARDLGVGRNASVGGALTVTGATTLNGATTINNTLGVNGNSTFTGSGGNAAVTINHGTSTRALDVSGAMHVSANNGNSTLKVDNNGVNATGNGASLEVDGGTASLRNSSGSYVEASGSSAAAYGNGASMYVSGQYAELHNSDYNGLYVESNRSQLYGGTASSYSSLTLNGDGAAFAGPSGQPVRVTGVADGRNRWDAVNKGQLDNVEDKANAGVAAAVALAGIPSPAAGKQYSVGLGWGNYEGENAFALGGKAQVTPEFQLSAGWGYSNEGNAFNLGAGYSW